MDLIHEGFKKGCKCRWCTKEARKRPRAGVLFEDWEREAEKILRDIRNSQILTAADYAVTITV